MHFQLYIDIVEDLSNDDALYNYINLMQTVYNFIFFCYFLSSSLAFYFWGQKSLLMLIVVNFVSLSLIKHHLKLRQISKTDFHIIISFIFVILWSFLSRGLSQFGLDFLRYFPILLFCLLPRSINRGIYDFINKSFQIFLVGSFIVYLLVSVFQIDLPNFGLLNSGSDRHTSFVNYLLYIEPQYDYLQIIPRFNACFLEPGHLGMICAFMLISNRFNFSKLGNIIYLISLIFSLSLAGYLLCIIGFILLYFNRLKYVILFVLLSSITVIISITYNDGDNIFNNLIVERLQFDDDAIERNTRTSDEFNMYFSSYMDTKDYWFGISNNTFRQLQAYNINGAGYKIYIMNYGIIGVILLAFFYYSISLKVKDKKYSKVFLIILICAFIQRAYPWWFSWILPLYGSDFLNNSKIPNK